MNELTLSDRLSALPVEYVRDWFAFWLLGAAATDPDYPLGKALEGALRNAELIYQQRVAERIGADL